MFDDMPRPAPGYLTVPEAAKRLSVVPNTVRRLITTGELPATKVGDQWLVSLEAVDHRLSVAPRHGRRMTCASAWGLLFLSDGQKAPWLTPVTRWRMKRHLATRSLASLRAQLVDRGRPQSYRAHPAMLDRLRDDPALMLTGVTGASELRLGLIGGGDRVEAYVDQPELDAVIRRYHLRPSREPNVILRVVPSFGLSWPPARVAPISAIALDLLDDPEPRAQQVGNQLLGGIGS